MRVRPLPPGLGVRALSSVGVVLIAAVLVYGPAQILILVLLGLGAVAVAEMYGLLSRGDSGLPLPLGLALVGLLVVSAASGSGDTAATPPLLGIAVSACFVAPLLWGLYRGPRPGGLESSLFASAGALYVGWPLAHIGLLRTLPGGSDWLLLGITCTWASDTGACLVGATLGRHKLIPHVSPSKTVEGSLGALAVTVPVSVLVGVATGLPTGVTELALLGLGLSVAAQLGDLAESYIKRLVGAKDSGNLLPGHGGLLDRIDGLLWAVVVTHYVAL